MDGILFVDRSAYECEGQVANCWSPGVRDLDCPNSGYCCFNGCVAKCLEYAPKPVAKPQVRLHLPFDISSNTQVASLKKLRTN